jgi:lipopolysaccharide heptosyltransferase I
VRVAIIRLTSLGDVVHTIPVAAAIRRARPDAYILWLAEEREQVLLVDNPAVDEVVVAPLRRWREHLGRGALPAIARELRAVGQRLRRARIDVVLDVQGWSYKTTPFTLMTGAQRRIGFAWSHARDPLSSLFTTERVTPPSTARHVVDMNLSLLQPLGIADLDAEFPFPRFEEAQPVVDAELARRGLGRQAEFAVLLPSTRGVAKKWPSASFGQLAAAVVRQLGLPVLLLGGPGEESLLDEIRAAAGQSEVSSWAPGPIGQLVETIRRSTLAIGNDTGPLHVAAAMGVASVGLFGPTSGERNGPYGRSGSFIQSRTGRVADIRVDEVVETAGAAWRALAGAPRSNRSRR